MASAIEKIKPCSTGKRSARGNTHAQELAAAAIHFQQFTRAAEELLAEVRRGTARFPEEPQHRGETDGLRAQGEDGGTTWASCGPLQGAAPGRAIHDFAPQQIGLADELGGVRRGGMRVDLAGRSDLLQRAITQQGNAVGERHGFFLIVSDKRKVIPTARCRLSIRPASACADWQSSAERGSSSRRSRGRLTSARARATRCCWPPLNLDGREAANSCIFTMRSASSTRPPISVAEVFLDAQAIGDVLSARLNAGITRSAGTTVFTRRL